MKTVIIVQARMTSTRLPGKVMKTVLGKPLLEYLIERLRRVKLANKIVIATTMNDIDLPIVELCAYLNIACFRGSEDDVLARYHGAAIAHNADVIVRVTSDCPVIDPKVIDNIIKFYLAHQSEYDYVSNRIKRTYPRGMDSEIFSLKVLNETFCEATEPSDREHVTPFIYRHPKRYRLANVSANKNQSHHRWTVDTHEDFLLVSKIIEMLYPVKPEFNLEDILHFFEMHPEFFQINAHVEQKKVVQ
jgi:spore coat polysaccharide biosynthesis protein SpsF